MIQNKTRIYLTWFAAVSIVAIAFYGISKEMNDVASACVGALALIIGGYQASKTITNIKQPKNET